MFRTLWTIWLGKKWFSTIDQGKAYHQAFMNPESKALTAFVTPWGFYEWCRIPIGLKNAPAEFQRYMEGRWEDLCDECSASYLDNVIIFSKFFDEHIKHVRKVLQRSKKNGIKLKGKKCDLFKKEVKYLGQIVSQEGYHADPENIKPIVSLKERTPKTVGEIRS